MRNKIYIYMIGLLTFLLANCSEKEAPVLDPPTLTAQAATDLTRFSATLSGSVKLSGGSTLKEYGLAYSTVSSLAEENTERIRIDYNSSQGTYEVKLSGLTPDTEYYYRFYASNGYTEVYSEKLSFKTKADDVPILDKVILISITESNAEVKTKFIDEGGSTVKQYGFAYRKTGSSTEEKLVEAANKNNNGEFSSVINGLEHSSQYEIRAYAINDKGTGYSDSLTVSTSTPETPSLTISASATDHKTISVTAVLQNTGIEDGITEVGFYWSKEKDDLTNGGTQAIAKLENHSFSTTLTELEQNVTYYIKAYAINKSVTGYSEVTSATTARSEAPVLGEVALVTAGEESLVLTGSVTDKGGHEISALGYLYQSPDNKEEIGGEIPIDKLNADGTFQFTITGLDPSTTYQVRTYATNLAGTGYSSHAALTTDSPKAPELKITATGKDYKSITVSATLQNTEIAGNITEVGFYWSKKKEDLANGGTQVIAKLENNSFTTTLTELEQNTTYYIKAYALNRTVPGYSEVLDVQTERYVVPTLGTLTLVSAGEKALVISGSITDKGSSEITSMGYLYQAPESAEEIKGEITMDKLNTDGTFQFTIAGLQPECTYQVRAFAVNETGTGYSSYASLTTSAQKEPTLSISLGDVTSTTIALSAAVTDKGTTSALKETGFIYSKTNQTPTLADNKVVVDGAEENYSTVLKNLEKGTTYYVRAYAKNDTKTGYSEVKTVTTTRSSIPSVDKVTVSDITESSAIVTGKVLDNGNNNLTSIGFSYKTATGSEMQISVELSALANDNTFKAILNGLNVNTEYQVRAYAGNKEGTGYGEYSSFKTADLVAPKLTATTDSIAADFVTLSAVIQSAGKEGAAIGEVGFCWSTTNKTPTISDTTKKADLNGMNFGVTLTNLKGETTYYIRAYAANESTIGYSNVITLTTPASDKPNIDDNPSPDIE